MIKDHLMLLVLLFSTIFAFLNISSDKIAKGVSVKNIDLSEVPVKLKKINEKIDVEKNYEKIIVGKPVYSGIDYYKSDCGLVIASNKNNIFEIFNIKAE